MFHEDAEANDDDVGDRNADDDGDDNDDDEFLSYVTSLQGGRGKSERANLGLKKKRYE